ncbi:MAG TPA: chromosomal replication initiator protein DnaA [Clostridiaceae bacterium]|nr:chromosomal replication initiator protein DnaA [Clostridiaceae bacterium]
MTSTFPNNTDNNLNIDKLWQKALPMLSEAINSKISFETWILPLKPVQWEQDTFVLLAPDDFVKGYAEQYSNLIKNTFHVLTNKKTAIKFIASMAELQSQEDHNFNDKMFTDLSAPQSGTPQTNGEVGLFSRYTFDTFVVGSSNRFAHAACVAIANQQSANSYNPLFLYGGSGLGKTHLMHAIGNHVRKHFPAKRLIYVQCEQFVNEFINTIGKGSYNKFRNKYRNCDLFMIDDIQFIEGKEQMQIEFFYTFNTLYEQGANIVMTCDKPPNSLSSLEERLRTRFASGLIVDIQPPDYETRVAIINQRCDENRIPLPNDVINYIATNIQTNIRELEGACNTVMAFASLSGDINLQVATDALKDVINPNTKNKVTEQTIIDIVCNFYDITQEDIKSKRRNNEIAYPRQVAMYLLRHVLDLTYEQIAKIFGNHYSTVMHSCDKIETMLKTNEKTQEEVESIRNSISM